MPFDYYPEAVLITDLLRVVLILSNFVFYIRTLFPCAGFCIILRFYICTTILLGFYYFNVLLLFLGAPFITFIYVFIFKI